MSGFHLKAWVKKNGVLFLAVALFFLGAADYYYYYKRLYPGIFLKDTCLGKQTLSEAAEAVNDLIITFTGPDGDDAPFALRDMGIEPFIEEIILDGYGKGREQSWPFNTLERQQVRKGTPLPLRYRFNEERFNKSIEHLDQTFSKEPVDASFQIINGQVKFCPEEYGYRVNKVLLAEKIKLHLNDTQAPLSLSVPAERVSPSITASYFEDKGITAEMALYSTAFDPSVENRVYNIELAADTINHYLLEPQDVFSFNRVIGKTTPEKGYKEAPIIQGGEFSMGYGGGICQVSTTLYNAVLLANLQIIERHPHLYIRPYVPPGRDATVFDHVYDLTFKNNRDHDILIVTHVEVGEIYIAIIGAPMKEKVEIVTREIYFTDPPTKTKLTGDLPPGEEETIPGSPGGQVEVWRVVYYPGGEKQEELLFVDTYYPYPTIITKGMDDGA